MPDLKDDTDLAISLLFHVKKVQRRELELA